MSSATGNHETDANFQEREEGWNIPKTITDELTQYSPTTSSKFQPEVDYTAENMTSVIKMIRPFIDWYTYDHPYIRKEYVIYDADIFIPLEDLETLDKRINGLKGLVSNGSLHEDSTQRVALRRILYSLNMLWITSIRMETKEPTTLDLLEANVVRAPDPKDHVRNALDAQKYLCTWLAFSEMADNKHPQKDERFDTGSKRIPDSPLMHDAFSQLLSLRAFKLDRPIEEYGEMPRGGYFRNLFKSDFNLKSHFQDELKLLKNYCDQLGINNDDFLSSWNSEKGIVRAKEEFMEKQKKDFPIPAIVKEWGKSLASVHPERESTILPSPADYTEEDMTPVIAWIGCLTHWYEANKRTMEALRSGPGQVPDLMKEEPDLRFDLLRRWLPETPVQEPLSAPKRMYSRRCLHALMMLCSHGIRFRGAEEAERNKHRPSPSKNPDWLSTEHGNIMEVMKHAQKYLTTWLAASKDGRCPDDEKWEEIPDFNDDDVGKTFWDLFMIRALNTNPSGEEAVVLLKEFDPEKKGVHDWEYWLQVEKLIQLYGRKD